MTSIISIDVLIIGSGPSGISTALHLVHSDPAWAKRILVIDKAIHPREKLCGGGITHLGQNVLAEIGLPIGVPNFEIREVRLQYRQKSYSFLGNPVFRIVRRDEFDHWLVQTAEKRGVTIRQGELLKEVIPHEQFVEVVTDKAVFHTQVLVAADGSKSTARRRLKWDDDSRVARLLEVLTPENGHKLVEFENGIAVFDFTNMDEHLEGYYWDFPSLVKGKPVMNRGVFDSRAVPSRPKPDLPAILQANMAKRQRNLEDYTLKGHPIRWFDKKGKFSMPHIVLTGDAAGTDPLFGEGISFALGYGRATAKAIGDAFARQDFSFANYRQQLLADPLLSQLPMRTWLARLAYLSYPSWLIQLGWQIAGWIIQLTPWRKSGYVPAFAAKVITSSKKGEII